MEQQYRQLISQLNKWNGRRQLRDGLIWVPRGLLIGLLLGGIVATAARLRPLLTNRELGFTVLGLATTGLIITLLILLFQRRQLLVQARFADRQFWLQERASTAVELQDGVLAAPPIWMQQQLTDTLTAVNQVDTPAALPLKLNQRDWLMILLAIGLLATAVILQNPQTALLQAQRAIAGEIEAQTEAVEELVSEIEQNDELTSEQQDILEEPLTDALESLQDGNLSQEEAVAVLSEAEAELRELSDEFDNSALRETLQTAGEPLANQSAAQQMGEALQNGDLAQAGAAAAQLADQLPALSAQEQAELSQALAETAAALQAADPELAQELQQAADALAAGDVAAAQQALRETAATLQQRAQENNAAAQAQAAANQIDTGREAIAEAGQAGESAGAEAGQNGTPSQGQQGNEGAGESGGGGQTGDGQTPGQQPGGSQGNGQNGAAGSGPGGGHVEDVFVPDFIDLGETEGVDVELSADCAGNPANCGSLLNETPTEFSNSGSTVPYDQVFGDYRNAANEALSDDHIPLGLKGFIRDYFSSLEP